MSGFETPYLLGLLVGNVLSVLAASLTWSKRSTPGVRLLSGVAVGAFLWNGGSILMIVSSAMETKLLFLRVVYLGVLITSLSWFLFAIDYSGNSQFITRQFVGAVAFVPLVLVFAFLTNSEHQLVWDAARQAEQTVAGIRTENGILFYFQTVYANGLLLIGNLVLLWVVYKRDNLYRTQSLLLIAAAFFPQAANTAFVFGPLDFDPTGPAISAGTMLLIGTIYYSDLLDLAPATSKLGRDELIERMDDGVLVLSEDGRVADANPAVREIFETQRTNLVGTPVDSLVPELADTDLTATDQLELARTVEGAQQYFDVRIDSIGAEHSGDRGWLLTFRNVTEQKGRRQELERQETILSAVGDPVYTTDNAGHITFVNEPLVELLGYDRNRLEGMQLSNILLEAPYDRFEDFVATLQSDATGSQTIEATVLTQSGDEITVEATIELLDGESAAAPGTAGVVRDISDRKQRVETLRQRERELVQYETIVETISDGVLVFDDNGRIKNTNERAATMFGRSPGGIVDESISDLAAAGVLDDDLPQRFIESVETLFEPEIDQELVSIELQVTPPGAETTRTCSLDLTQLSSDRTDGPARIVGVLRDITDQHEYEAELQRYETILEAVGDPVFTLDETGTITYVNQAAAEMAGYSRETMIDSGAHLVMRESDYEIADREIRNLVKSDRTQTTWEMEVITRKGNLVPVECHAALLASDTDEYSGIAGIMRDVSDRKEREAQLSEYGTIIETIPNPVYMTDANGRFTFVNNAFEAKTGYSQEYLSENDVHFSELIAEGDTERLLETIRDLQSDATDQDDAFMQMEAQMRDGRWLTIETNITLLPSRDDEFSGTAGIFRDISDRKRRQEVLSVMNRSLRHNLRTNVNQITGYVDILEADLPAEKTEYVGQIKTSAEWLQQLGEMLRTLQKAVDQGRESETTIDGSTLIEEVVTAARQQYPEATIKTHVAVEATLHASSVLQHSLEQLIENAIVHNDSETPQVHVWVANASEDGWIDIHIEDNGPGIAEAERELVLGDESITQLQHGSGIGLWIARWIVEVFDGELLIEENDPTGTVVTVRLKQADAPAKSVSAPALNR